MFNTLNLRAALIATAATLLLVASIIVGSRNLGNFDPALIAYLFGCIFACFGVVYRYTVWLQRPPTWRYFARGWKLFFTGRTIAYGWELVRHFVVQFLGQKFIRKRGKTRGYGHMLMAWGSFLAFAITFPLVFGWIHFGLKPGGINTYEIFTFGFKVMEFPLHTLLAEIIFNGLNWSAILVIAGVMIMMRRRLTHAGQIAIQTFEGDWLPLLLLLAISRDRTGHQPRLQIHGGQSAPVHGHHPRHHGDFVPALDAIRKILPHHPAPGATRHRHLSQGRERKGRRRSARIPARPIRFPNARG